LINALEHFGIPAAIGKFNKKKMQERCARGVPWAPGEREDILAYCETDVTALPALLEKLLPRVDLAQAVDRGRFTKTVAHMEGHGIPVDVPKYTEVIRKRSSIQAKLITPVYKTFQVYSGITFKLDRFVQCLEREGITDWPKTPSGRPVLKPADLTGVLAKHTQMRPLFDLRGQIGKLRRCALKIGHDGFARTGLTPFVAATGRRKRIYLFLIAAPAGYAIASLDWSGQEIAIAAAKSGDDNLLKVYKSGDAHLAAGKLFGIIRPDGTTMTHAAERDMIKPVMFGSNYGAGEALLARLANISVPKAHELRLLHRRTFKKFWAWIERVQLAAYREGKIETGFGWAMKVPPATRATTLLDWPMQAIGNEMMRLAACEATDAGITLCCTVHDAFILRRRPRRGLMPPGCGGS
jgi:DNA polymerase family A